MPCSVNVTANRLKQTIRDQLVFTNKRIIVIDVQGFTGKRRSFTSLPYSKVQFFAVQTPGFMELFPDSESFEFKGKEDIGQVGRIISEYVLA